MDEKKMVDVQARADYADYFNLTPDKSTYKWGFMGTGFTKLDEVVGAQTGGKRYVNNRGITKRVTGYEDSFPYETDIIKSDETIAYICNIGEKRLIGSMAETDYLRVDLKKPTGTVDEFEARLFHVSVEVANFVDNDGEMSADGNLLPDGAPILFGKFNVKTKTLVLEEEVTEGQEG